MARLSFGGQDFMALGEGALFWPGRRALVLADLHLEKASWYARGGQMLPPYDSLATLDRLDMLVARHDAREVWTLGDSFHDEAGPGRLPPEVAARLCALVARVDWTWITGNHDEDSAGSLGGAVLEEAAVDGIMLRHQADPHDDRPELSGHFHPKWRIGARGRSVSRRCFVQGESRIILPAFGALAGGLIAHAPVIRALAGPVACALVPVRDRLLRFPIG
ncbi:ligase-associated DNA damage response endonuclease PdeM [Sphingobium sufflavum]|uniref:ligase-associated DNA damage response endonuclease PdeM n=1 Tax=Sphingobium sufflavum TaxID=1129547 RepID=UPI001F36F721|nr:ligase-associated DNA damage response endonuclease PdeM [Sphingobium sufflavum]MCE7795042.1 ligase-associated DNA damage response endonuclease PdeM [Sphingobium sufflavum]